MLKFLMSLFRKSAPRPEPKFFDRDFNQAEYRKRFIEALNETHK